MDQEHLNSIRHSCAHLLAAAVLQIFPGTKNTIGPAIENGFYYDFDFQKPLTEEDLPKIEEKMQEILKTWQGFEGKEVTVDQAKEMFKDNPYKLELINEFAINDERLTIYTSGDFTDLCKGGHSQNPQQELGAFKLLSLAGAYWRGSEKNKMLTRIYGTCFPTQKELDDNLNMLEESKKRDHRKLGQDLEFFTFSDEVGQGLPLWLPKGTIVREEIEKWAKDTERKWGYQRVSTPHITKKDLYEISGHLPYYADDLYAPIKIEEEEYYLKPMNCPHTHMIFKSKIRSYRELPLRLAEYGQVYRFERSGSLHGLMRTRGFCQNDAHIYVKPEDAVEEFVKVLEMHKYYYDSLGIKDWWGVFGVRDPQNLRSKYHGDDKMWEEAERLTKEALDKAGVKYVVEEGGAAHYGPKLDIYIRSAIGKEYAIGTSQLDLYMPQRFNLTYTDAEGKVKMPYVIHRAPLGSHERMIGFLLEHFAGAFPVWLSPIQVMIVPISDKNVEYGQKLLEQFLGAGIRVAIDTRSETMQAKIRDAQMQKIPYMVVIGDREQNEGKISVRKRSGESVNGLMVEEFVNQIKEEIGNKG